LIKPAVSSSPKTFQSRPQLTPPWRPEEATPRRRAACDCSGPVELRTSGTPLSTQIALAEPASLANYFFPKLGVAGVFDATKASFTPRWESGLRVWKTPNGLCKGLFGRLHKQVILCSRAPPRKLDLIKEADHLMTTEPHKGVREEAR